MSERSHAVPVPEGEYFEANRFAGTRTLLAVLAVIGVIGSLIGGVLSPTQFGYSWLFGFIYFFTLCTGCLFWIIVHHAVDAEWSVVVRRQLENVTAVIPVLAVLFLPLLVFHEQIWRWMSIPEGTDAILDTKRGYLNWEFFLIRAVFFLAFFILAGWMFRRLSMRQDKDGNPAFTLKMRKLAFVALPLFALCLTFAAFDWLSSLNHKWFSTMWGPYIFAGAAGSSMSLLVLIITGLRKAGYLGDIVSVEHYHTMGKWIFAFSVFWAYIGFSQYMLIWYANIPEETEWFILRNTESWWYLSNLLVFGRFFFVFGILLLRSIKKQPTRLAAMAGWILFMQMLDMYIVVMPELHSTGVAPSILDPLAIIGIGATLGFFFLRILSRSPLFPVRDPRLIESLRYQN